MMSLTELNSENVSSIKSYSFEEKFRGHNTWNIQEIKNISSDHNLFQFIMAYNTVVLTLYHTVRHLMTFEEEAFWKHLGKGENVGNQHFLFFPKCFLPILKQNSNFNPFPNKPWFFTGL